MKRKEFYALGIMSGTSIDGLDFSLIRSDGINYVKIIQNKYYKFSRKIREEISNLIKFSDLNKTICTHQIFKRTNTNFNTYVYKKIQIFFSNSNFNFQKLDIIGFHGNTIIHNPKRKISIQLGDPFFIAKKTNTPVIANFRIKDIKMNGEGAPLVPIYHKAIFAKSKKKIIVVNIGGISNYSFLEGKSKIFASDIGPGNTLIDRFCYEKFNKFFDKNGLLASRGKIDYDLANKWVNKKIFSNPAPTSFDIKNFKYSEFLDDNKKNEDLLRTLTFFSAKLISDLRYKLSSKIDYWIFAGGGTRNPLLMRDIKDLLGHKNVYISNEFGFDSSFIESCAFAFISIRTLKKLPSAFPDTTGCQKKNICGYLFKP